MKVVRLAICAAIAVVTTSPKQLEGAVLLADWRLNNNLLDSSGNNLNGAQIGSGITAVADRFGNANSALHFAGSGYIRINDPGLMSVPSYSMSMWFTWDAPYLGTSSIDFLTAKANENFEIHTGGGGGVNGIRLIPSGGHYNDNPNIIHSGWNNLTVTFDNTTDTSKVYLDGVLKRTLTQATGGNTGGAFYIGARANGSFQYHGNIDDVKLYDGVLSQAEVSGLFGGSTVPEPTSLAVYSLGTLALLGFRSLRRRKH
jgi:hypothetical protein